MTNIHKTHIHVWILKTSRAAIKSSKFSTVCIKALISIHWKFIAWKDLLSTLFLCHQISTNPQLILKINSPLHENQNVLQSVVECGNGNVEIFDHGMQNADKKISKMLVFIFVCVSSRTKPFIGVFVTRQRDNVLLQNQVQVQEYKCPVWFFRFW